MSHSSSPIVSFLEAQYLKGARKGMGSQFFMVHSFQLDKKFSFYLVTEQQNHALFHNVCSSFHKVSCFMYYQISSGVQQVLIRCQGNVLYCGLAAPSILLPPFLSSHPVSSLYQITYHIILVIIYSLYSQPDFRFPRGHRQCLICCHVPTPNTCYIGHKFGAQEIFVG